MKKQKGFTLIELLVVISIVGILSGVVLSTLNSARAKARDAQRYSDLYQIRTALNMYFSDIGVYPSTLPWILPNSGYQTICNNGINASTIPFSNSGATGWIPNLAPLYIPSLPSDPQGCLGVGNYHGYLYKSNGIDYKIMMDWSAEIADQCGPGKAFYDWRYGMLGTNFCSLSTPGGSVY
ncbi:MAG: prepilin-type N-terminal cleavage/methylation domain-containing protein [Minisyncoccia bacterium]